METDPPLIGLDQHAVENPVARGSRLLKMVSGREPFGARAGNAEGFVDGNGRRRDRRLESAVTRFGPIARPDVDLANGPVADQVPGLPRGDGRIAPTTPFPAKNRRHGQKLPRG